MIDWNTALKLGLIGIAAGILGAAWLIVRGMRHQRVPFLWIVGLGLLFFVSALTAVGSQLITVESKFSSGTGDA